MMSYQDRVDLWVLRTFGLDIRNDKKERNHRFFEEAGELVQSWGMTKEEAHMLVDYVWGRPVGDPPQELGGVMVTVHALANANGLNVDECAENELIRCNENMEKIRAKQAAKPRNSPLPA